MAKPKLYIVISYSPLPCAVVIIKHTVHIISKLMNIEAIMAKKTIRKIGLIPTPLIDEVPSFI